MWRSTLITACLSLALCPALARAQDGTTTTATVTGSEPGEVAPGGPASLAAPAEDAPPAAAAAPEEATSATSAEVTPPAPEVQAEPPPAPEVQADPPPAPASPAAAAADAPEDKDSQRTRLVRNIGESGSSDDRHWFVSGSVELRMLAVSDPDPANDRSLFWALRGGYGFLPNLSLFGSLGLEEQFVAEEGESGFRFSDAQLALNYNQSLEIPLPVLGDHTLSLTHRAGFYLPTSRRSQANDVYLVPELLERARINLVDRLYLGVDLIGRYQITKYAEGPGPGAPTLTQLLLAGTFAVEYNVLESDLYGYVTVGFDLSSIYRLRYAALDSTGQQRWKQAYGWSLYAVYAPYPFLALTAVLATGDDVVRADGARRVEFLDRDASQLIFNVTARY